MRPPLAIAAVAVTAACAVACSGAPDPDDRSSPPAPATAVSPASGRPVTFSSVDGVPLTGTLFGTGRTAVVLSNMGDNDPTGWERFAPVLSERGYLVLTYTFRDSDRSSQFTAEMGENTEADLAGAIAFLRDRGATDIALIGASLGGMATANLAGSEGVGAAVVLSSPVVVPGADYEVDRTVLRRTTIPVLYVAADNDPVVPAADTRRLYRMTAGTPDWQSYPERAHGTELLDGGSGAALTRRLIDFLAEHAPAEP